VHEAITICDLLWLTFGIIYPLRGLTVFFAPINQYSIAVEIFKLDPSFHHAAIDQFFTSCVNFIDLSIALFLGCRLGIVMQRFSLEPHPMAYANSWFLKMVDLTPLIL
jgi:hypothetical protein